MLHPRSLAFAAIASLLYAQTPALASDDAPPAVTSAQSADGNGDEARPEVSAQAEPVEAQAHGSNPDAGTKAAAEIAAEAALAKALPVPKLSESEMKRSVECLALNIYHEARSEPRKGQQAVAAVTINRVASPAFPNSVCQVVKQGGKKLNKCQFSWWCDRYSDKPREDSAWHSALELSRRTLAGEIGDPTDGALYYHAKRVKPRWARTFKRTERIGQHLFYKPRGV